MNEQFGVGTVMGTGFRVWAKNIVPFALITAVIYAPMFLWSFSFATGEHHSNDELMKFAFGVLGLSLVLNVFVTATITYGVVMELQGKRASIVSCVVNGFKRLLPALGVALLAGIAIVGGCILLVVPGVIVMCMLYVATPASVIEKPGVMGALKRSSDLTKGHKGQIFGIMFLLVLIGWVAGKIQGAVIEPKDLASIRLSLYVSLGVQVLTGSLGSVMSAVAYYYLRNEKEGTSASELAAVFE